MSERVWGWLLAQDDTVISRHLRAAYIAILLLWSIVAGPIYQAVTGRGWTSR